jgi:hypothetical protein
MDYPSAGAAIRQRRDIALIEIDGAMPPTCLLKAGAAAGAAGAAAEVAADNLLTAVYLDDSGATITRSGGIKIPAPT